MDVSKLAKTPIPVNCKLLADEGDFYHDPAQYRCLVGKLNFLTHTRPDISDIDHHDDKHDEAAYYDFSELHDAYDLAKNDTNNLQYTH